MYYGWTIQGDELFCREGRPGAPRKHRGGRRRDARFGRSVAGQDRVPRPEGGLADVQEDRRRIRRHLLGPLRQLLQVQDVNLTRKEATSRFSMTRKKYQS